MRNWFAVLGKKVGFFKSTARTKYAYLLALILASAAQG
jgi:hypothetical protein